MAVCYSGDIADVDQAVAPIRGLSDPVFDLLAERPYVDLQSYLSHGAEERTLLLENRVPGWAPRRVALDRARLFGQCPIPEAQIGILPLEGAPNERPMDDGAVGNRSVRYVVGVLGAWSPDEHHAAHFRRWVREAGRHLQPFSTGSNYVNFQTGEEGSERIRATYGTNFDRFVEAKRVYDPENVFSCNRNSRPSMQTVV